MQENSYIHAVVASADERWSSRVAHALAQVGCKSTIFEDGLSAVQELRRQPYEVAVVDSTIRDLGMIEFCFHVRDLHGEKPVVLVAGAGVDAHRKRFRPMRVYSSADRTEALDVVPDVVEEARRLHEKPQLKPAER